MQEASRHVEEGVYHVRVDDDQMDFRHVVEQDEQFLSSFYSQPDHGIHRQLHQPAAEVDQAVGEELRFCFYENLV